MTTKLSSKGQVVLPGPIRRRLGLEAGAVLEVRLDGDRVILTRDRPRPARARIKTDPATGLPVLSVAKAAAPLTSAQVADLLAEFP